MQGGRKKTTTKKISDTEYKLKEREEGRRRETAKGYMSNIYLCEREGQAKAWREDGRNEK